jgi:hypothetical protein
MGMLVITKEETQIVAACEGSAQLVTPRVTRRTGSAIAVVIGPSLVKEHSAVATPSPDADPALDIGFGSGATMSCGRRMAALGRTSRFRSEGGEVRNRRNPVTFICRSEGLFTEPVAAARSRQRGASRWDLQHLNLRLI